MKHTRTPLYGVFVSAIVLTLSGCSSTEDISPDRRAAVNSAPQQTTPAQTLIGSAAPSAEKSLYDRLGGVFAISAVVNHFSDALIENPVVGRTSKNPALKKWSTANLDRLPGLKFMRTLWVCNITGGPFKYVATVPGKTELGLEKAHDKFRITSEEFDEVAAELGRTLDFYKVPKREKEEVLAAFAAHKREVLGQ